MGGRGRDGAEVGWSSAGEQMEPLKMEAAPLIGHDEERSHANRLQPKHAAQRLADADEAKI